MPISLSAKKSLRKSLKNHKDNSSFKNNLRTKVKEYLGKPSTEGLNKVFSFLDKAKKKHLFHPNKVARLKSEYSKKLGKVAEVKKTVKPLKKKVTKKVS